MSDVSSVPRERVLLIDDDSTVLRNFRLCLEDAGYQVNTAHNASSALSAVARSVFDVCVLDLHIGDESGLDLLPQLRAAAPWMRVVMATAESDASIAVATMRSGAADYLIKPCSPEQLLHAIARQIDARRMERRIEELEDRRNEPALESVESANPLMARMLEIARQAAESDATILILGESGTGKNVLARAIHNWSNRRKAAFATVNCPSLSAELLESELFGHVKGAFTGAHDHRQGRVQVAEGGTLFLDEIGEFPLSLQPKFLRFLQDREYERVGDPRTRKADVRLIAATNRDLAASVAEGTFRGDLYYRLNVISLTVPALRERPEDVMPLARNLLTSLVARYRRPARRFSDSATNAMMTYSWPGNVRELANAIERAVILCAGEEISYEHLPFAAAGMTASIASATPRAGDPVTIEQLERAHIEAILGATPTLDIAAKTLGIDASTLYRKRKAYGLG
ncbi:sigma-54-dependent transcriptional regulator [Tahibacter amnicola]|uniref:Sigma-54 dependent transcriptional regulator n=1 Tax=Tahibacter amnicola TaxID=2976241 RepID=A0ABY6BIV3_9GAMM|nr:sigma-54 dependent transcriptional regulator [Tahibacter amnicola]UXI68305.1 sigma-54 dependent transcriptional regulator [Tahibacter amnicola]